MPERPSAGCSISETDFSGQDFSHQDFSDSSFVNCNFSGCSLRATNLSRSVFTRCELNDAAADNPADLSQALLSETRFEHCNLSVVDFVRCRAYGAAFEHCQMQGADFSKSDFTLPVGTSKLASLTIDQCNLSFGNLSNCYLARCRVTGTRLVEACLDYVDLSDSDLRRSEFHNVSSTALIITGADLRDATFNNLDPRRIDLAGVKIYPQQMLALVELLDVEVDFDTTEYR